MSEIVSNIFSCDIVLFFLTSVNSLLPLPSS